MSPLRSVTFADPFRRMVMSADVSRRFRIFDIKSASGFRGFPPPAKLRPRSARVPRLGTSPDPRIKKTFCCNNCFELAHSQMELRCFCLNCLLTAVLVGGKYLWLHFCHLFMCTFIVLKYWTKI